MSSLMDNSWVINTLQVGVPFAAYFIGIVVRKVALPGQNSPSLGCQMLLGIPVSLVIVSPVLTVFGEAIHDRSAYLLTVGIIMEHGMLVTETAAKHLQEMIQGTAPAITPAGPVSQPWRP
jgi:hypothetical protein